MNRLFKKINLNAAFFIAAEIINIVSSENCDDKLDDFLCLNAISHDEFIVGLLNKNTDAIIKPSKNTILHAFISEFYNVYFCNKFYYFIDDGEYDDLYSLFEQIRLILQDCELDTDKWEKRIGELDTKIDKDKTDYEYLEKEVKQLVNDLKNEILELNNDITGNIFFLLFSNKKFLFDFNLMISKYITPQNLPQKIFNKFNHIIRCTCIPKWLQNGIKYRDRMTCQQCGADLSNSWQIQENGKLHFDHIIPLEKGGTNDAINFQLLCSTCNLSKNDTLQFPDYHYQMFW